MNHLGAHANWDYNAPMALKNTSVKPDNENGEARNAAQRGLALFVLGGQDVEMREIERVLASAGLPCAYAATSGVRTHSGNAYQADGVVPVFSGRTRRPLIALPGRSMVLVECSISLAGPRLRIDHHNPGDPGYDAPPADYLRGSSLGQLLELLDMEASADQLLIAAADHCLSAAYRGQCPGIDPDELLFMRAAWQGLMTRRSLGETMSGILDAAKRALDRFDPTLGASVFLDPTRAPRDLPEGAARAGVPVIYRRFAPDGSLKEMIKGSTSEATRLFMAGHEALGHRVYGNPHRGYAGAYLP